jgi:glyoxylase-like metal-dependent hydrolase (beta-lactamase superfamily II)
MAFLTEPDPVRGAVMPAIPGISRIVAPNPGPMTYHGTNTWLIDEGDGFTVVDPGPDSPAHVEAVLTATRSRVVRILLSHTHHDHLGALPALKQATGAPVWAFRHSATPGFIPDHGMDHGDAVAGWTALHTPGHAADHLCFVRADGVMFSADHVMSWSTSVVGPPQGDMQAYFDSLRLLLARDDTLYLPGHGPPLPEPRAYVADLLAHRIRRESAIASALREGPHDPPGLVELLYTPVNPVLRRAAERNVVAHLLKLQAEGRARPDGEKWRAA